MLLVGRPQRVRLTNGRTKRAEMFKESHSETNVNQLESGLRHAPVTQSRQEHAIERDNIDNMNIDNMT